MPASKSAQKAEGILFCEFNTRNGYHQTLTVWETKKHMIDYSASTLHLRVIKLMSKIGIGKVFGYEADSIPSWEDALTEWNNNGREF